MKEDKGEKKRFGRESEEIAAKYLKKKGLKIYKRNYRTPIGECDIIAKDGETFVFVEVKSRRTACFDPLFSITKKKRQRLVNIAKYFLCGQKTEVDIRFDAVAVTLIQGKTEIEHIENAFIADT